MTGSSTAAEIRRSTRPALIQGHISELDAIRAVGIILVVLNHTWPAKYSLVWWPLQLAWALMDSFFVLSGFLITGILLDTRERPDYYRTFYFRRSLRILPVYYLVLTGVTLAMILGHSAGYREMLSKWGSPLWFFVYLGNIPTAISGSWPNAGSEHWYAALWSLQIEEQFYLLFPLLVRRLNERTLVRVLIGLAIVSPLLRLAFYLWRPENVLIQYVFLPCRLDGLALGALLAVRLRKEAPIPSRTSLTIIAGLWCLAALAVGIKGGYLATGPVIRTAGFFVSSVASSYVIFWLIAFRGSPATAILRHNVVQYFSKISYGIYLFQGPVIAALRSPRVVAIVGPNYAQPGLHLVIAALALSTLAAAASWKFVEAPFLGLRHRSGSGNRGPAKLEA
jgi:peptidoglycan/LPS O-acetylase OafA/YrhL